MTTYLVSRHQGAVDWINHIGHHYDVHVTHLLDIQLLKPADVILGTLPIYIIDALIQSGISYYHLSIDIPEHLRGQALTAAQLSELNASLVEYIVVKMSGDQLLKKKNHPETPQQQST